MNQAPDANRIIVTDGNPAPDGLVSFGFRTPDGRRLRVALSPSALPRTRGTVIVLQGRNEAIEKYFETIGDLNALGYMVLTFDWRGQGGSDRLIGSPHLGHVRSVGNYVNDLDALIHDVVLPDCRGPFAILAHSLGGLIALHAAPRLGNRIERMVLSAPLVAFPPRFLGSKGLGLLSGAASLVGLGRYPLRPTAVTGALGKGPRRSLSSDPRRLARNRALAQAAPQLFLGSPTIGWFAAITRTMAKLEDSDAIAKLSVPTLIVGAGDDRVVSTAAAERLAWRMRAGSCLTIPYARHEILQEADRYREPFMEAFEAFVGGALPA